MQAIDVIELNPYAPRPFVFTEICLCLRDSLRRAGLSSEHLFNSAGPDPARWALVPVPLAGWQEAVARLDPARTLLFNLEQLGSSAPQAGADYVQALAGWAVADYNRHNLELLRQANGPAQVAFELPLVPSPTLAFAAEEPVAEPSVDVLFYGSLNPRREQALAALRAAGLVVEVVQGAYAWELAPALRRAKVVLHVHYNAEARRFPVGRVLQPLAAGVAVVCEEAEFSDRLPWAESGVVFAPLDHLATECLALLANPGERQRRAQQGRQFCGSLNVVGALEEGLADARSVRRAFEGHAELGLAPESHLNPPPLALVMREPGKGGAGKAAVAAMMLYVVANIVAQYLR